MVVYYFKYKGKPSGKIFIYTSSNKAEVEKARRRRVKFGFKCTNISKGAGNSALIYGGRLK
jgi:hypothetical protein